MISKRVSSVSKALGLTSNQMQNAMSIATSSSAGLKQQFGFSTKALHCGLAAQTGLQAAFFAKSNFTELYPTSSNIFLKFLPILLELKSVPFTFK